MSEIITKKCGCVVNRTELSSKGNVKAYSDSIIYECDSCKEKKIVETNNFIKQEALEKLKCIDFEFGPRYLREAALAGKLGELDSVIISKLKQAEIDSNINREKIK